MSVPDSRATLTALPAPLPDPEAPPTELGRRGRSSWPTSHSTAWALTALVTLAITGPIAVADRSSALLLVLIVPAGVATLVARLVFESLDSSERTSPHRRALPRHRGPDGRLFVRLGYKRAPLTYKAGGGVGSVEAKRPESGHYAIPALAGSGAAGLIIAGAAVTLGLHEDLAVLLVSLALGAFTLGAAGAARDLEIRVRLSLRRVFLIGDTVSVSDLRRELIRNPEAQLVGATGPRAPLGERELIEIIEAADATVLVLDGAAARSSTVIAAASALNERGVRVRELLSYYEDEFGKVALTELTPAWFLFERGQREHETLRDRLRRTAMRVVAAVLLAACLPLLGGLAAAVRLTSPGPAIFRQPRVGKNGMHFTLLKLRTMRVADPGTGPVATDAAWATDLAHRVTPLGRLLRRYRLDELPQLWNVLRGELALIGPRPEQVPIVERLEREIPYYAARHTVRPGITGWAQVNLGYAGSLEGARAKLQRDLYYVKHRSLRLDLLILWLTVKAVFSDPS